MSDDLTVKTKTIEEKKSPMKTESIPHGLARARLKQQRFPNHKPPLSFAPVHDYEMKSLISFIEEHLSETQRQGVLAKITGEGELAFEDIWDAINLELEKGVAK
jgi:hypothetical protein